MKKRILLNTAITITCIFNSITYLNACHINMTINTQETKKTEQSNLYSFLQPIKYMFLTTHNNINLICQNCIQQYQRCLKPMSCQNTNNGEILKIKQVLLFSLQDIIENLKEQKLKPLRKIRFKYYCLMKAL